MAPPAVQDRAPAAAPAGAKAPFVPLDACTLLTRAEVEALAGKKILDGRKEELANLVTCSFGDPTAPQVAGRALTQVLTLSVMTGKEGAYYAGPVAQIRARSRRDARMRQTPNRSPGLATLRTGTSCCANYPS